VLLTLCRVQVFLEYLNEYRVQMPFFVFDMQSSRAALMWVSVLAHLSDWLLLPLDLIGSINHNSQSVLHDCAKKINKGSELIYSCYTIKNIF
jgi:hypothetical protein